MKHQLNTLSLLFLILFVGCYSKEPVKTGLEGKSLPNFSLLLPDSTTYFNSSIPNGKPVVLFYFSPQCPYCKAQMEDIIANINTLKDVQFYIFSSEPIPKLKEFYTRFQLRNYSNIITGVDYKYFFASYFGAHGVPYTAIYGKKLNLLAVYAGKTYAKDIMKTANN